MRTQGMALVAVIFLLAIINFWLEDYPKGHELKILFVPLDTRPITYTYPQEVAQRRNLHLVVPPLELMNEISPDIEGLYQWLEANISKVDGVVLSTDTLIYGGLVPSRTHNFSFKELQTRVERLRDIIKAHPKVKVYGYTSIMRLPQEGGSKEEPPYYEQFGAKIYQLSVLKHKEQLGLLTTAEAKQIQELSSTIPAAYLDDYLARRRKNLAITRKLLQANPFDYLVLSRDDTSEYGFPRMEYLKLRQLLGEKSVSITGADEIGLLLLARMVNVLENKKPRVFVDYANPQATHLLPRYEDESLEQVVAGHITVAGSQKVNTPQEADLILMVNNLPGPSLEASAKENSADRSEEYLSNFVGRAREYIRQGKPVAIADIAFANGADNRLVKLLLEGGLYFKLESYAGWNTASNSLGSAIAELMLRGAKEKCLATRLVEDWAYQANVRQMIKRMVVEWGWDPCDLKGERKKFVEQIIGRKLNEFLAAHGIQDITVTHVSLPRDRTFEIDFSIKQHGGGKRKE